MLSQYLWNVPLAKAILSWFIACLLKTLLSFAGTRRFDLRRFVGNGGMPSSHTAFTVALATAVGLEAGFSSIAFAITAAFALVVMSDATGVRYAAGKQAQVLNEILDTMHQEKRLVVRPEKLKELLGHTPLQVVVGALLAVTVALVL